MSEDTIQAGWDRQRDGRTEGGDGGPCQFHMIQRGDFIKPGWWHWRCRREDAAGDVAYGYVEADTLGRAVAAETFAKDPS
jgi:hypothetical protein